jgi:hypothetical protein
MIPGLNAALRAVPRSLRAQSTIAQTMTHISGVNIVKITKATKSHMSQKYGSRHTDISTSRLTTSLVEAVPLLKKVLYERMQTHIASRLKTASIPIAKPIDMILPSLSTEKIKNQSP